MVTERAAIISRADLLRCWVVGRGQELDGVAAALGFTREVRPEIRPLPARHIPPVIDLGTLPPAEPPPLPKELPPVEQERMHFYRVTKRESLKQGDDSPTDYPAWYTESDETLLDQGRVSLVPQHQKLKFQPLVPWARLWPFLHNTLSNLCSGWQPDMEQVVKRVAQGELLRRMPLKSRKTWAGSACVLVDINAGTFGLRYDFIHLRDKLLRLRGEYGLQVRYLEDEPGGQVYHWEHEREVVELWVTPPPDVPLLIISDLGALTQSRRKLYAWLVFGRELAAKGCRPVVLMPVPVRMIDARLLKYFTCISWDRGSRLQPVMNVRQDNIAPDEHQAKVRQLLNRLAPAVRVNSSLLRATRYLLASEAFDVGHEAAVWQHPAIQNHGDEFVWQISDHEQFLQAFRQLPAPQQQAMVDFIARYHATLPEVVYFEAMQNCIELGSEQVEAEVQAATQRYRAALIRTFNEHPEFRVLGQWADRFEDRHQANILRQRNAMLAAIKGIQLRRSLEIGNEVVYPVGIDKELIQPFLSAVKIPHRYELRQQGSKLVFIQGGCVGRDDGFEAQGSLLTTLQSGVDFIIKNSTIQQDLQASHILRFEHNKTATVALAGMNSYEFETDRERITVESLTKPAWAIAIGSDMHGLYAESKDKDGNIYRWYWHPPTYDKRGFWFGNIPDHIVSALKFAETVAADQYGIYADIRIAGIIQRFRWIEPMTFQMGSPKTEEGRYDHETPHQVNLTQGYWLSDTVCTQTLWKAVTNKNYSFFENPNNPVENVSWSDIEKFLQQINDEDPKLQLRLPTEAEWENACRAGTTCAFNFEGELSIDKVNYRGTWDDYNKWGEGALQQTAKVKSYPSNRWGLYEMHGNVWECCQDWYGDYSAESVVIDPQGMHLDKPHILQRDSWTHVLRGGSWIYGGGHCRSAYRLYLRLTFGLNYVGFRLARNHDFLPVRKEPQKYKQVDIMSRIHKSFPDEFPQSWASDWGEDEFGLFMGFTYKGVRQGFRWIEPGSFIMGSPEDEPDREPNGADETQKEVKFPQGFWIADVPVTQALWEAVMGNNPSNFSDPDCPVENINWDDAQAFISRMNEMKPELKLCLPLEAQWEYACRAGTTSPFYFGDQITSTLANFDGSNPYNGGGLSEFRQQTVKVKSFPPNAWGLYEMHGNVWEWCQDEYGLNIPGEDPSIIRRVLKGGSWLSNGSDCRSAHRSRIVQTHRHSTYGFRLALFSEDFSIEENWFVDEQDENQSWFWEEEARRVVESALENSDWDEESKSITLTAPDDERHSEVVRNRDQLESFLTAIAGSALYANAPRDEGDFILIDNDEYAIVAEILEEYEQRLEEFFSEDE